ncbi:MAG: hypothetical protein QOI46_1089 [Alphaproteobacteria bacterium]|nr:hypothetical protein [Alphaproteobacteria bacterium]
MGSRKNLGLAALLHHGLDARVGVNGHTPRLGEPFPIGAKHEAGYGAILSASRSADDKVRFALDSPLGRAGFDIQLFENANRSDAHDRQSQ